MYKLNGHSLTRGEKVVPETQPMTLQERESSCSITLGPDTPEIGFNEWLLDDEWPEGNIVWRVKSIGDATDNDTVTIELEHAIKTLSDRTLNGAVTTKMISGGNTCTARQAIEYILSQQSDWVLGDCEFNISNPYEFDGDELFDAIGIVTASLEDSQWEYDMSVYPFRLHIRQRNAQVGCEMRSGRNLSTMRRSISRSGMYTRIYPTGKNNLQLTEEYLSKNENLYGRKDHRETDNSISTKENLRAWAQGRLNRHCEPVYTVTISGLELSQETGEDLDRLKLNRVCRVPLPKRSLMITERIVKLQWRDRRKEPENVTVTLANNNTDVTTIIRNAGKASGKAASGQAKQNYLFQANGENLLYEVFDDCGHVHGILRMTEESLRIAFDNTIESTRSEFQMTSESLRIAFQNEAASLRSDIQVQAGRIGLVVTGEGTSAAINISAIANGINNDSTVEIIGDRITIGSGSNKKKVKVYIDGKIQATEADITNLTTGTTKATLINAYNFTGDTVSGGTVYATTQLSIGSGSGGGSGTLYYRGAQLYKQGVTMGSSPFFIEGHFLGDGSATLSLNHYHKIEAEEGTGADAGKIIITLSDPVATNDSSNHVTNFNIADTTAYKNGVLSARNAVKVNPFTANAVQGTLPDHRTFTYTTDAPTPSQSTPQADTWYIVPSGTWSSNKQSVSLRYGSSGGTAYATTKVDASSIVTAAGYSGRAAVSLSDPTANAKTQTDDNRTFTVSTSGRTNSSGVSDNLSKTVPLHLYAGSWSSNKCTVYMKWGASSGSGGTTYAQIEVDAGTLVTNAGYSGRAAVTLNDPAWNAISGDITSSRTLSVTTSGRTNSSGATDNMTKSTPLYLTSSGLTVYLRPGSSSGAAVAKLELSDGNLTAGNIKKNVSIFGVTGTYQASVSADDISIGPYNNVSSEPSGTTANTMRDTIIAAMNSKNWFRFKVSVLGVEKYYKFKFS